MDNNKVSQDRSTAMQAGNAELQSRLLDLIRGGLVELDIVPPQSRVSQDFSNVQYFEEFAARMVDAQLGSIGKRIRTWANFKEDFPDTWHEKLLDELGSLYLFSKAFQNIDRLSENLQDELLALAGVTTRTSELFQQEGIQDDWLVLGQVTTPEPNNLTSRRTWFIGHNTQKIVLVLEYTFGAAEFTTLWLKGMVYLGEAVYYPSTYPLRVAFKSADLAPSFREISGHQTMLSFLQTYSEALAQSPWLSLFPVLLTCVTPIFFKNNFFLVDTEKKYLPIEKGNLSPWELIALSGGHPLSIFGEWNGQRLKTLNVFSQ